MFQCAAGHSSELGEHRVLVPVEIREVHTTHTFISKERSRRRVEIMGVGTEVVKEEAYCEKHAPEVNPKIVDSVTRHQVTTVKLRREDDDEDEEE